MEMELTPVDVTPARTMFPDAVSQMVTCGLVVFKPWVIPATVLPEGTVPTNLRATTVGSTEAPAPEACSPPPATALRVKVEPVTEMPLPPTGAKGGADQPMRVQLLTEVSTKPDEELACQMVLGLPVPAGCAVVLEMMTMEPLAR